MQRALVTGGAGFIGSHLVDALLADGWSVTAVDNFDPFYDPCRKRANIARHQDYGQYELIAADIRDLRDLRIRARHDYDVIVHLAAKAGVRPSIQDRRHTRASISLVQRISSNSRRSGMLNSLSSLQAAACMG
jgi:UDP-glucuronate 4-epimerase